MITLLISIITALVSFIGGFQYRKHYYMGKVTIHADSLVGIPKQVEPLVYHEGDCILTLKINHIINPITTLE